MDLDALLGDLHSINGFWFLVCGRLLRANLQLDTIDPNKIIQIGLRSLWPTSRRQPVEQ